MDNDAREPHQRRTSADRLHSPSRERVLRELEARGPLSIAELTQFTGLHENTIRGHLHRLLGDGYVRQGSDTPAGRGRPTGRWSAVEAETASPYAGLAVTLAEALAQTSADAPRVARVAGREWGTRLAEEREGRHGSDRDPRDLVMEIMREQGFAPYDEGGGITLRRCPLLAAANRRAGVVCAVHEGMIEGMLRSRVADARAALEPFALNGACGLRLHVAS